jgi:hypothetical protein
LIGNHFHPQQKQISKVRDGAKVTKRYDPAQAPLRLVSQHASFNPATVQRQVQALCADLLTRATTKNQPTTKPVITPPADLRPAHRPATARGPPSRAFSVRQQAPRPSLNGRVGTGVRSSPSTDQLLWSGLFWSPASYRNDER